MGRAGSLLALNKAKPVVVGIFGGVGATCEKKSVIVLLSTVGVSVLLEAEPFNNLAFDFFVRVLFGLRSRSHEPMHFTRPQYVRDMFYRSGRTCMHTFAMCFSRSILSSTVSASRMVSFARGCHCWRRANSSSVSAGKDLPAN